MLKEAGLRWHQTQAINPKRDEGQVLLNNGSDSFDFQLHGRKNHRFMKPLEKSALRSSLPGQAKSTRY